MLSAPPRPIQLALTLGALVLTTLVPRDLVAAEPLQVLLLSKSSGFEHSAIRRDNNAPGHVERVLAELAERESFQLTATKDASQINEQELAKIDVVIFYTTGDLTDPGSGEGIFGGDGESPMAANGLDELLDWIRSGGGFMGFHCATDTFHSEEGSVHPYIEMLGGEFATHGKQFEGAVTVVDAAHPTAASMPGSFARMDEWYVFKNLQKDDLHVVALLDPADQRREQATVYDIASYPVQWVRGFGDGRVYYNAMGHREDVWDDSSFQSSVVDAIRWAAGQGPLAAEPNYSTVVGRK